MAVQPSQIKPNLIPSKQPPTNSKVTPTPSSSALSLKTTPPTVPTSTRSTIPPTTPSITMLNQPEPKKRKWLWILLGLLGFFVISAIVVGLYIWLA